MLVIFPKENKVYMDDLLSRQQTPYTPISSNKQQWMEHHLYVCYSDSLALKNHLTFRNALLNNPILAENYEKLKRSLIEQAISKEEYTKRKTNFILEILAREGFTTNEIEEIRKANS